MAHATRSRRGRTTAAGAATIVMAALALPAVADHAGAVTPGTTTAGGVQQQLHPAISPRAATLPDSVTPHAKVPGGLPASGRVVVQLELSGATGASVFSGLGTRSLANKSEAASTQEARETEAQKGLIARLDLLKTGATVVYQTTALSDAVAISVDVKMLPQIAKLAGVTAIHQVAAKFRENTRSVPLTGSPQVWSVAGGAGKGVNIAIIDTGIDYTHSDFGGAGTPMAYQDARDSDTMTTDASGKTIFPTAKVTGGTDLVGDAYDGGYNEDGTVDTDPAHLNPQPDANPLDCAVDADAAVGHGTHVAGIAAGEGVIENPDGTYKTYTGSYNADTDFSQFHVGPGTAPLATLSAYRVFGCAGATFVVSEALDDIAKTRMDDDPTNDVNIVNLSLGADLTRDDDPDAVSINRLAQLGVLPVVAAGNSGDLYEIGGSPGDAARALTAAATDDGGAQTDALKVDSPAALAGSFPASLGSNFKFSSTAKGVAGGTLARPVDETDGCTAFDATDQGILAGKVAVIDADGYAAGGSCASSKKGNDAVAAGAVGVVIVNGDDNLVGISGATGGPTVDIQKSVGQKLLTAIAAGPVTVDLTIAQRNAGALNQPENIDKIADFTSRGGVQNGDMKPDVGAPGVSIFSAKSGSGGDGISYDGTSMATPHTAGIAAEVLGVHPKYTAEQLKAAVMNTADSDLTVDGSAAQKANPAAAVIYGPTRVGAGRIDANLAVPNSVLAYVGDGSGSVSANFGLVPVTADTVTLTKPITIQNTGTTSETYTPSLDTSTAQNGVVFSVPTAPVTIAGGATTTLTMTMTATRSALTKTAEATRSTALNVDGAEAQYVAEATGRLLLTPTDTTQVVLRVPYGAAVRPASAQHATGGLTYGPGNSDQNVTLTGAGVNNPGKGGTEGYLSTVSAYTLNASSPQLPSCLNTSTTADQGPNGCIFFNSERSADLKYVGTTSTVPALGLADGMVEFGLASYAPWVTPSPNYSRGTVGDVRFRIFVDTNGDGVADRLVDIERAADNTDLLAADTYDLSKVGYTDDSGVFTLVPPSDPTFDDALHGGDDAEVDVEYLNGVDGSTDTDLLNSDVLGAPVSAAALGLTAGHTTYTYTVVTQGLDNLPVNLDSVGPITVDAAHPALSVDQTSAVTPTTLFRDQPGTTLPIALDRSSTGPDLGLLLLHHDNLDGQRAEVVPEADAVAPTPPVVTPTPAPPVVTAPCTVFRQSFLAVGGLTKNPLHYGSRYRYRYLLKVVARPGSCTPPSVNGLTIGLYDNGHIIGKFKTGADGSTTVSVHLSKGSNKLTAVYYGSPTLAKSFTGKPLVQSAKLL